MNRKLKLKATRRAHRAAIESLEKRTFFSTAHLPAGIEAALNAPAHSASALSASPANASHHVQANPTTEQSNFDPAAAAPQAAPARFSQDAAFVPSSASAVPNGTLPVGASMFVSQVFALLSRVSIPPASAVTAPSDAIPSAIASTTTTDASIGVMAVEASAATRTPMSLASTTVPASAIQSVASADLAVTTVTIADTTAPNPIYSTPSIAVAPMPVIAPQSDPSTINNQLGAIAAAMVHTAAGRFAPIAQAIASSAEVLTVQDIAPIAYNFVRFDASAFLTGAVADFTNDLASMTHMPDVHGFTPDPRWAWLITGAVITADVVLIAQWQIRRAQANRARVASTGSLFSATFVSEFVHE